MEKRKSSRVSLSTVSLILSLVPLGVDLLYFLIALLNYGNWAFLILALYVLPAVHFLLGIGGLVFGITALSKKQRKARTYIALVLSGIYVLLGCVLLRFLFNRFII